MLAGYDLHKFAQRRLCKDTGTIHEVCLKLTIIEINDNRTTQPAFICSQLAIETLEQGVKYVQS